MYVSWTRHTVQLTASIVKEVVCEKCRTQYFYAVQCTESGLGTTVYGIDEQGAQDRARRSAGAKLENALNCAIDLVPCPNCGTYPPDMVNLLKNAHMKWMALLGWLLVVVAPVLLVASLAGKPVLALASIAIGLAGLGLIMGRRMSAARYDPNAGDAEERKQIGRNLAFVKNDATPKK
jgi:hypothetical protein